MMLTGTPKISQFSMNSSWNKSQLDPPNSVMVHLNQAGLRNEGQGLSLGGRHLTEGLSSSSRGTDPPPLSCSSTSSEFDTMSAMLLCSESGLGFSAAWSCSCQIVMRVAGRPSICCRMFSSTVSKLHTFALRSSTVRSMVSVLIVYLDHKCH